jgi:hypothetical protein
VIQKNTDQLQLIAEHVIIAYDLLRAIASTAPFPGALEVREKLAAYQSLKKEDLSGHELHAWYSKMNEIIWEDSPNTDMRIWNDQAIEQLDFMLTTHISDIAQMGLATSTSASDINKYRQNVVENLGELWSPLTDFHRAALGKIEFILTIKRGEFGVPLPLLCPSFITSWESIYAQFPEALKEVSVFSLQ